MTEVLMLIGIAISGLFLIDPFFYGALSVSSIAKTEVIVLVFGPMLLHFAGRALADGRRWNESVKSVVVAWWPAILLAGFIVGGSIYARYESKIEETFLNFGLGLLTLPLMALAIDVSARKRLFFRGLASIYVLLSLAMYAVAASHLNTLHEQIFIAVPLGALLLLSRRAGFFKSLVGLTLVTATAVAFKNTTFVLIVFSLASWFCVGTARIARRDDKLRSFVLYYLGSLVLLAALVIAVYVWWIHRNDLPDGNTKYRLEMYRIAWGKFAASPIWGTWFAGAAVSYFSLYTVAVGTNYLPTHSDILDLLANGGLIAISLWALTVWRILKLFSSAFKAVSSPVATDLDAQWRWLFVIGLIQLGAVVTYSVNPPLNRLVFGFWIWGGAAVMWALHRSLAEKDWKLETRSKSLVAQRGLYAAGPNRMPVARQAR